MSDQFIAVPSEMKECPNCGRRHMCRSIALKQTAWDETAVANIITDNLALTHETCKSVRRTAAAIVAAFSPPKGQVMHTVTESIYAGKSVIVPLADVQHIETHNPLGLIVVTKHTRWDKDGDFWANSIWIDGTEAASFKRAWCTYRAELEVESLMDLSPS